jgi:hypothetical protein
MCRTDATPDSPLVTERTRKTGPQPERVKIEGDWEDAIKRSLAKKRPPEGWPSPPGKKKRAKKDAK